MKYLVLGSTGKLGNSVSEYLISKQCEIINTSRKDSEHPLDLINLERINSFLDEINPEIIINCSGNVNFSFCEDNKDYINQLHVESTKKILNWSEENKSRYIHISTDHFFDGNEKKLHKESDEVNILNHYARTKFHAEQIAAKYNNSVIIRTSFISFSDNKRGAFGDWLIDTLFENESPTLFDDSYTSSLDIHTLNKALFEVSESDYSGLINIGIDGVYSKAELVIDLLERFSIKKSRIELKSVKSISPERASSLGLDTSLFRSNFETRLPKYHDLVDYLYEEIQSRI